MKLHIRNVQSGLIGLGIGLWWGLMSVPTKALDIPTVTNNGHTAIAYHPVPSGIILLTIGIAIGVSWLQYQAPTEQTTLADFANSEGNKVKEQWENND